MYSPAPSYSSHCSHQVYPDAHHRSSYPMIPHHHHHHPVNQHESNWLPALSQHNIASCPVQSFTPDSLDGNNNESFAVNHMNGFPGGHVHSARWPSSCTFTPPEKTSTTDTFFDPSYSQVQTFSRPEEVFHQPQGCMFIPPDCQNNIMSHIHDQIKREHDPCLDLLTEDYSSNSSSIGTIPGTVPDFYTGKFSLSDHSFNSPTSPSAPEDDERRKKRRERNKVAATKCRHKKKEHVVRLNIESEKLESSNISLKGKLASLEAERNRLIDLLNSHQPFCLKMSLRSSSALQQIHHHQNHSHESHIHHSG